MTTSAIPSTPSVNTGCAFCPHPAHGTERCSECKCKGKRGFWGAIADGLGNAIGNAWFGGN